MNIEQNRQKIQQQKELPALTPDLGRILAACEDRGISQSALAEVLGEAPSIAARLLGLANSAFFGQPGQVRALPHAIAILGMVTVKSITAGLALSGVFDTKRCPAFRPERYWLSAVMTAVFSQQLAPQLTAGVQPPADSLHLAGLLHNIGLLALAHLEPEGMEKALAAYAAAPERALGHHLRDAVGLDHYQAGVWLGSKWHFPRELLLVMQHHYNPEYHGDHWPLVLLEGLSARWANQIIDGHETPGEETRVLERLGLSDIDPDETWMQLKIRLDDFRTVAAAFLYPP